MAWRRYMRTDSKEEGDVKACELPRSGLESILQELFGSSYVEYWWMGCFIQFTPLVAGLV